jgi:integrase
MARVRDLWFDRQRRKTARHPGRGGSKDAKRWLAIWLDPDGNEKSKAFRLEDAAKKFSAKMEADAERGEYVDPKAGREEFGVLALKHLRLRKVGGGTRRTYESVYRNHVEPVFGNRSVKSIRPSEISEWLQHGPVSAMSESVQSTAYQIVRGTFELAIADKLRRDNPAASKIITKPHGHQPERKAWDTATVLRVISAHPEPYRAVITAEAGLGLRQGEALGLGEEDIDFGAGTVTVRRQLSRQGGRFVFKMPKGEKERTVPMSRGMAQALRAHIAAWPPRPYSLPWMDKYGKISGTRSCRLMFRWHGDDPRTHDGHILATPYDRTVWKPALHAAGLIGDPVRDERGILRWPAAPLDGQHAARHWFSVTLQDGGVSLAGVMDFMGHSRKSQVVTVAVYGHVTPETLERARVVIDANLFRLRAVEDTPGGTVAELRKAR